MPRFFTTSNFEIIKNKEKILKSLFDNLFDPSRVILEEDPGFKPKSYQGYLEVVKYSPNKIIINVSTENPTLVYFSDNYSKAFKVFVDGKEGKIIRANYTFRAIPVSKGNHTLIVYYDSAYFVGGFTISLVTISTLLIMTLLFYAKKNPKDN